MKENTTKPSVSILDTTQTFVSSVELGLNTGGNIYNDVITLNNGMVIRISEDLVCIYKNAEADENGDYTSFTEMVETTNFARVCTECKKGMNEGYVVNGGEQYYCSDACLHKHHTPDEWKDMSAGDDNDSNYWTAWEDTAEQTININKRFSWKDKTGRGFKAKFTLSDMLSSSDDVNWDNVSLHEWAENAEEGDEWENAASKYICIEG